MLSRKYATDTIKEFIEYSKAQGSQNADRYYQLLTTMINKILFGGRINRNTMDSGQLWIITTAEQMAAQTLRESMNRGLPYRECYQEAKKRILDLKNRLDEGLNPANDERERSLFINDEPG
ncbi:MAG: hypothetical protein HQM01_07190 [Magnetococcales bacterium]|nr:hypothetical protein [Magnetococcales bacterium]